MKSNFKEIINTDSPVLVNFFADWCSKGKMLAPILKEVKAELGEKVKIVKVNVDKNAALASQFQVLGVPTMILFKNGNLLWRQSGILQKKDLISIIKQHN